MRQKQVIYWPNFDKKKKKALNKPHQDNNVSVMNQSVKHYINNLEHVSEFNMFIMQEGSLKELLYTFVVTITYQCLTVCDSVTMPFTINDTFYCM